MGDIADMMLEGFLDEETGEIIDGTAPGYPRRMSDRKQDREFRASCSKKNVPCVIAGCNHKFRHSTQYGDFVVHFNQHHRKAK